MDEDLPNSRSSVVTGKTSETCFDPVSKFDSLLSKIEQFRRLFAPSQSQVQDILDMINISLSGTGKCSRVAWIHLTECLELQDAWPTTVYQLERLLRNANWASEVVDICVNECCSFEGLDQDRCELCGEARFNSDGQARKSVVYLPMRPRLLSLLNTPGFINLIKYDHKPLDNQLCDIQDSTEWRRIMSPIQQSNPSSLALACCVDGVNKGKFSVKNPSLWLFCTKLLSLPPAYRNKPEFILLQFVLPAKPKRFGAYADIYAKECARLYAEGIAGLLFFVADSPAMSLVTGTSGSAGIMGCHMVCHCIYMEQS